MGKASARRKDRRREYLQRLAKNNPEKFRDEWAKRLESWAAEANRRARRLADQNGTPTRSAFSLLNEATGVLAACGAEAVESEEENTREVLTNSCCRAVARAVNPNLYRLSNAEANRRRMELGTHKPPR